MTCSMDITEYKYGQDVLEKSYFPLPCALFALHISP